ncbi:MAG: phosphatase PAP2 family protein [Planctomycetaceae bacterium]|nr:phosphatase PAP2 family protein [Planctomycetaceae bacterium]
MNYELRNNLKILLLGVACAVVAFFFLDHPLGVWLRKGPFAGDIRRFISCGELFGHGAGIFTAVALIYVLDQANRRKIPRVLACALLPGLVGLLIKIVVCRTRPYDFDYSHAIEQTFTGLSFFQNMSHSSQGFPSGHTTTAVGLAIALSWLYPHGRRLFAVFAVWVALQRMVSEAHFLSDTICGATLAFLVAGSLLPHEPKNHEKR